MTLPEDAKYEDHVVSSQVASIASHVPSSNAEPTKDYTKCFPKASNKSKMTSPREKNKDRPKRPLSAYNLYFMVRLPGSVSPTFKNITKKLSTPSI